MVNKGATRFTHSKNLNDAKVTANSDASASLTFRFSTDIVVVGKETKKKDWDKIRMSRTASKEKWLLEWRCTFHQGRKEE